VFPAGEDIGAVGGSVPAGFAPRIARDGNEVDELAAAHGVMNEVRAGSEPEIEHRLAQFGGDGRCRD